ncbi:SRPBCC family protein [Raineyella fluvialis]|uniref:SRPBCC domain-containing protein n=1 Tax=Raineyella fluvialis TaxID=2662261 RepID=A0A5Q2F770_9ACTN|nr:SRPBCC domain-containing protein [Raineyella fluvialis]QGF22669.1 SRPBCC domain-containing protein [Raineyella fluvialis]
MTVTTTQKDLEGLTLTFVTEFDAPVERVWQLWADPRKLERWWGPPSWPATFTQYDFVEGGAASYFMTGPDGSKPAGWWTISFIDAPHRLEFDDGFADEDGYPVEAMGAVHGVVTFETVGSGTRMTVTSHFQSREQFDQMAQMGMEEGMREALGQMDAILADVAV